MLTMGSESSSAPYREKRFESSATATMMAAAITTRMMFQRIIDFPSHSVSSIKASYSMCVSLSVGMGVRNEHELF